MVARRDRLQHCGRRFRRRTIVAERIRRRAQVVEPILMLIPFERRVRHREANTTGHGPFRVEAAPLLARSRHRPRFESVRQERVVLPLRGQIHRRNPARAIRLHPFQRKLSCPRAALGAEASQRLARRKRTRQGRGPQRFPPAQMADLHVQRLAVIRVGQFILCSGARLARRLRPALQIRMVEVLHDVLRPLDGDSLLVTLPRDPFALDLV